MFTWIDRALKAAGGLLSGSFDEEGTSKSALCDRRYEAYVLHGCGGYDPLNEVQRPRLRRAPLRVVNGLGLPRGWVGVGSGSHRPRVEVKLGLHGPCGGVRVGSHGLRVEVGLGLSKLTLD